MNVAIIGAGWYGCHIGLYLKQQGHDIKIFEKNSDIFLGSSGSNQFRLHTGYHYPRSSETISETKKNFHSMIDVNENPILSGSNVIHSDSHPSSSSSSSSSSSLD